MHADVNCVCNVCGSAHSCGCWSMAVLIGQPFEYTTVGTNVTVYAKIAGPGEMGRLGQLGPP